MRPGRKRRGNPGRVVGERDPIGGVDHAITIDATNDSLNGVAAAINGTNAGVTATVQSENGSYRLVLKGATGAANAFSLNGIAAFDYPSDTSGMTRAQSAQDALLKVDGVPYQRPANSISDIVTGLTLTLKKAAPGETVSLTASRPIDAIKSTMNDFVSVFNDMKSNIAKARSSTNSRALFELERKLNAVLSKPLTSVTVGPRSMADLGVTTNRDGSVTLDSKKLDTALKAFPDAVEAIFVPTRDVTRTEVTDPGIGGAMAALRTSEMASGGGLAALKLRLEGDQKAIDSDRSRIEEREAAYKARLQRNLGSMDSRVAGIRATQSYLQQQIDQWNKA